MEQYVATLDLKTLLDIHKNEIFTSLHCLKSGTIQEFSPETQTATITINHKFMLGETIGDYPKLVDVPVFVPAGSQAALTMPIQKGDFCIVLFSDRDIGAWLTHGKTDALPPTRRKHNIADGFAIVGFRPKTNSLENYNPTSAELRNADGKVAIDENGFISMQRGNADLHKMIKKLIDCLDAFKVVSGSGTISTTTPDTKTELADIKTQFGELLK
jgi:hypothetical protein